MFGIADFSSTLLDARLQEITAEDLNVGPNSAAYVGYHTLCCGARHCLTNSMSLSNHKAAA